MEKLKVEKEGKVGREGIRVSKREEMEECKKEKGGTKTRRITNKKIMIMKKGLKKGRKHKK